MAYNILNGTVEFSGTSGSIENMVNTWQAQTIDGNKVFAQTLSASAFSSNAGAIVPPAITSIASDGANRVITSDGDATATAHANVTIVGSALTASFFSGSGIGLTNVRSTQLSGAIQGAQINKGNGLTGSTTISVQEYHGITVDSNGVSVDLMSSHGLVFSGSSNELAIDPSNPSAVTEGGQSLSDDDSFIIYDLSRTQTRKASANNIFSYINGKLSTPAITSYTNSGDNRIITSVNSNTVNAESRLTFNGSTNFLFLSGNAQIRNHTPTIFLSNSAGTGLGYLGYNNSDNILVQNNVINKHIVFKTNDAGSIKEGFRIDGAVPEVVVNQGSDSLIDFRVESNANTHMIFSDGSENKVGINNDSPQLTLDVIGDVSVSNHLALNSSGTVDPTLYLNHAHIYSKLDSGTAEVYVRDSDGNVTKISPHTPGGEWEYFSRNTRTGKVVRVNMERMIRKLEEFTGESFMEEWYEEPAD